MELLLYARLCDDGHSRPAGWVLLLPLLYNGVTVAPERKETVPTTPVAGGGAMVSPQATL